MSDLAAVLARQAMPHGERLLINPPAESVLSEFGALFTQDYAVHRRLASSLFDWSLPDRHYALIILVHTGSKALTRWLAREAACRAGQVWIVGHNRSGVRALSRTLGGRLTKLDAARHHTLYAWEAPPGLAPSSPFSTVAVSLAAGEVELTTAPGVFGDSGLDPATQMLLKTFDAPEPGSLDLGCGTGVITLALQGALATDTNALALECTRRTLARHSHSAEVMAADGLDGVEGSFDLIVSNPPFHHRGEQTLAPALRLIAQAPRVLRTGGRLRLVANRHLPYAAPLGEAFASVERLAQDARFVVYEASRPRD